MKNTICVIDSVGDAGKLLPAIFAARLCVQSHSRREAHPVAATQVITGHELDAMEMAALALDRAATIGELKVIRDKAEAARVYAKAARLGLEAQNRAATVQLMAERKAGQMLASLKLRGGDRRSRNRPAAVKLVDLGVSRAESKRWQQLASIPDFVVSDYIEAMNQQSRKITSTGLLREASSGSTATHCQSRPEPCNSGNGQHLYNEQAEAAVELANHLQLLTEILRPLYTAPNSRCAWPQIMVVGQLLVEMRDLTQQLTARSDRAR